MGRIKNEIKAIRATLDRCKVMYRHGTSIKDVLEPFTYKGTLRNFDGKIENKTYYQYMRHTWVKWIRGLIPSSFFRIFNIAYNEEN